MQGLTRVLVPIDGSPAADRAAGYAARLAAQTGARIELLHVVSPLLPFDDDPSSIPAAQAPEKVNAHAAPVFDRAVAAMGDLAGGLSILRQAAFGLPAEVILAEARDEHADMVVMGSRGLSPVKQVLLGSVSEDVVRHAPCPVTIVH